MLILYLAGFPLCEHRVLFCSVPYNMKLSIDGKGIDPMLSHTTEEDEPHAPCVMVNIFLISLISLIPIKRNVQVGGETLLLRLLFEQNCYAFFCLFFEFHLSTNAYRKYRCSNFCHLYFEFLTPS